MRGIALVFALSLPCTAVRAQEPAAAAAPPQQSEPKPEPQDSNAPLRRGLVQPLRRSSNSGQELMFSLGAFEAYDDDVLADYGGTEFATVVTSPSRVGGDVVDPRFRTSGVYSGVSAGLLYAKWKQGKRGSFSLTGNGNGTYQGIRTNNRILSQGAVGTAAATTFHKWSLGSQASAGYSPFYQLALILPDKIREAADEGMSREVDFVLFTQRAISTQAGGGITRDFNNRTSFGLNYSIYRTDFLSGTAHQVGQMAAARVTHRLRKGLTARAGYTRSQSTANINGRGKPVHLDAIDAGVDYGRALSFSRRTTLSFSTGTTIAATTSLLDRSAYVFVLTGGAQLTHEIGRTWVATAGVRRGVDFAPGFGEPLLSNTASAGVGGFLQRRIRLTAYSYYSSGTVGLQSDAPTFGSVSGNARLTVTVTRRVDLFGEYFYDRYSFDGGVALPPGLAQSFDRQGARARATARLTRTLGVYAEYLDYRYAFGAGADLPPGLPPSFTRQGARAGLSLVVPLLGSGKGGTK